VKDLGWDELLKTTLAAVGPAQEFLDIAGLRIERDVESILWCMPSSPLVDDPDAPPMAINPETGEIIQPDRPAGEKPAKLWLVVLRGKFSPKKITKALENHGKSAGAPVRKLKGEGTTLLQMDSPLGPIFLGLEGNSKLIVSNQLDRLKGSLGGGYDKLASPRFLDGMEGLTDKESLWVVQAVEGDFKKQLEQGEPADSGEAAMREATSFQLGATIKDGIQGKLTIAATAPRHADSIKTAMTTALAGWEEDLAELLKTLKELETPDRQLEKAGVSVEAAIAYLAVKQGKLEVKGNDMVLQVGADRKALEPLLKALGL
jgi:exonuclease VII small subunit